MFSRKALIVLLLVASMVLLGKPSDIARAELPPVDLVLGGSGATPWSIGPVQPGNVGTQIVTLHNAGSKDGSVNIWVSDIVSSEGLNPESETGNTSQPGELDSYLLFNLSASGLYTNLSLPKTLYGLPQSATDSNYIKLNRLRAGETVTLNWQWQLPPHVDNEIQGDVVTFTINYLMVELPAETVPVIGTVILQGTYRPLSGHYVPLTVKLYSSQTPLTTETIIGAQPLYTFSTGNGNITITDVNELSHLVTFEVSGVTVGTYNMTLYSPHNLVNLVNGVAVVREGTMVDMVELLEGDAVDIVANSLTIDVDDFSVFASAYEALPTSPNWDARADFDRNGDVTIIDFSLLYTNYGKTTPQNVTPP